MKAGRELDALIAEGIFEWEWEIDNDGLQHLLSPHATVDNFVSLPHYSTQIADTKQVWDKMISEGYALSVEHDCIAWSVCFTHLDTGKVFYGDWRQSLETQTCNVALKAVE